MTEPAEGGRVNTYQWLLRALGAYLDERPSCRISLAEVPDGFLVRVQRTLHTLEPEIYRFNHQRLREQLTILFEQRKGAGGVRHEGIWSSFPNGHADFFRALGYELDQESARNVLIDELEDGIVVTYFRPDNEGWKKRMVFLGLEDIKNILNAAFERRGTATTETPARAQA
jgi:hypothetical protein